MGYNASLTVPRGSPLTLPNGFRACIGGGKQKRVALDKADLIEKLKEAMKLLRVNPQSATPTNWRQIAVTVFGRNLTKNSNARRC